MRYVLITNLGLYDRDHSEKEYWVWESDGSEANFTSWNQDSTGTFEPWTIKSPIGPSNGCVFNAYPGYIYHGWDFKKMETYWYNDNCYAKNVALCQKKVADYNFIGSPPFSGCF